MVGWCAPSPPGRPVRSQAEVPRRRPCHAPPPSAAAAPEARPLSPVRRCAPRRGRCRRAPHHPRLRPHSAAAHCISAAAASGAVPPLHPSFSGPGAAPSANQAHRGGVHTGVHIAASGSLTALPRPWLQALLLDLDCPAAPFAPPGLPPPSPVHVTVLCTPRAWRLLRPLPSPGSWLLAEGEPCLSLPPGLPHGDLTLLAASLLSPATPPPAPQVTAAAALEVWSAEDGRCEACGRPLHLCCARFARVNHLSRDFTAPNLHLLCPDCKLRSPDPLPLARPSSIARQHLAALHPSLTPADASAWLVHALCRHGVLLRESPWLRSYLLPGVGAFHLRLRPDGPPLLLPVRWSHSATIRIRPQARTRGLPRPLRT